MITSALPSAIWVQALKGSPCLAAGRPLMKTELEPDAMEAVWDTHRNPPGRRCTVLESPTLAAPRPLISTSELPLAITYELQCLVPGSPRRAAAGMISPQSRAMHVSQ